MASRHTPGVELWTGPLATTEWPAARALLHRAFVDEPFTQDMYGPELLDRWGGSWSLYSSLMIESSTIALGARVGDVLVGVVMGSPPGHCRLCHVVAPEPRPDDHHLAADWQFHQNVAQVHGRLGVHAWIEKAAVEPTLHGLGIGRRLLESAATALEGGEPAELVLECAPDRVDFYTGLGYEVISTFADPAGPDASLMRRWIP
jgi:ribosomal protein S18 acetylase RimI-like enzyme